MFRVNVRAIAINLAGVLAILTFLAFLPWYLMGPNKKRLKHDIANIQVCALRHIGESVPKISWA